MASNSGEARLIGMNRASPHLSVATLALALAACQQAPSNNVAAEANAAVADVETLPPDESSDANVDDQGNVATNKETGTAAVIPPQYRGRWGMVAADCTSTRSDAKGLITIADKTIRFYESTATLKEQRPAISEAFSGLFAFTGEGQTWTRVETLTRTGDTLKRADEESTATYQRCA
jgi:hypothetical protein